MSSFKQPNRRANWGDYPNGNDSRMNGNRGEMRGDSRQNFRDQSNDNFHNEFSEFMNYKNQSNFNSNSRPNFNRPTNFQNSDERCRHKPITKQLVVATLQDHFGDVSTSEYDKVTIKYHCNFCQRDVYINVLTLGTCYGSGLLFVHFKQSKRHLQRETVLDYTHKKLTKEVLDQCYKYLHGDKNEEKEQDDKKE